MDEQIQPPQSQSLPQPQPQPEPQPQPQNQLPPKGGNRKIVVAAILIILIAAGAIIYYFVFSKKLQKAPKQELNQTTQQNGSESARIHGPEITNLVMTKIDSQKGAYLIDKKGMTLYVFDKDQLGKSTCSDTCLTNWPIFESPKPAPENLEGEIGITKATNGKYMYTYKGKPLYYYAQDKLSGDTKGDGVSGVWHLAKP